MAEMAKTFCNWRKEMATKDIDEEIDHVSLCLGFFYDGTMLNRYTTTNFIPAVFNIMNLPPSLRNKFGVGQFTLTVFQQKLSSKTEKFLMEKLIVEELLLLEKGNVLLVFFE
jgi:hypothetical protein